MEFRLLGPVEVWAGAERLAVGGPKPRALLAALLLERGRVVSVDRLIDQLWPDDPPPTARALIQTYVAAIRRGLAVAGGQDLVETRPPGYRITGGTVDLTTYEELVQQARQAGDRADALNSYRAASELWHGSALGGIGGSLSIEADRLNDLRVATIEEQFAAELEAGSAVADEIAAALSQHPLRERLRGQLMVALCRAGRQSEALTVYTEGRRLLADELGVDPGPDLNRIYEAVLRNDPALFADRPQGDSARPESVEVHPPRSADVSQQQRTHAVPAQLPAGVADFTGRTTELATLLARFAAPTDPGALAIQVISGPGGVGKSALALSTVHQLSGGYKDGQLYVDLGGVTGLPASPSDVVARFLRALGIDAQNLPVSLEERIDLYRTITAGRSLLVLLDDAASEQQVRPLLPSAGSSAVVITSRRRLSGLAGADVVDLGVLGEADAIGLLSRVAGRERVAAEPAEAERIVHLCGCLPLAVRTAGARLASRRHWTLARLATRLADERQRLDELAAGDVEVRASLAVGYQGLDASAQLAFRRLGLLSLLDFAPWIAGPLLDLPTDDAEDVVEQLVDAQLLELATVDQLGQVRYRMHELLQVYARERADLEDSRADRDAAVTRALRAWLSLIGRISANGPSGEVDLVPPAPADNVVPADVLEPALARPAVWFDIETPSMLASVARAAANGLHHVAAEMVAAMCSSSFVVTNRFDDWWSSHDIALQAAREAGDESAEAMLLAGLGRLRSSEDDYAGAEAYFAESLAKYTKNDDRRGAAIALAGLGDVRRELGDTGPARDYLDRALAIFRALDEDAGIGFCARRGGALAIDESRTDDGFALLDEALTAYRKTSSRRGEAITLRSISLAHRALGDYAEAARYAEQAVAILREIGDAVMTAYGVQALAKARLRLGEGLAVADELDDALVTCRTYQDRFGQALILRTQGELRIALDRPEDAVEPLEQSLAIWRELGLDQFVTLTRADLETALQTRPPEVAAGLQ
ncbi:BTAD domain-containing putative transcriptional regulator [Kribbella sp. NPDC051770]|uniref:AfsR/SARP family transcriptional regulator n=1 Tax=Kribbella sp. NPDC051770 TaxID=3155413 RepID=UPI0034130474